MRRDDLMKPDLLSEIVLVGGGMIVLIAFLTLIIAAVGHSAPLQ